MPWGDFRTYRNGISFSMTETMQERFSTRGEQHTAYSVARVRWDVKNEFLASVLPDVEIGDPTGMDLNIGSYGTIDKVYPRVALNRRIPQQHPVFRNMYVVDAQVLNGEGAPQRNVDENWIEFKQRGYEDDAQADGRGYGYCRIGLTWSTLPYYPYLIDKVVENEVGDSIFVPDEDGTNTLVNSDTYNELTRYCRVKPINKGQNLQVKGRVFYFVDDDGTAIRANDAATGNPIAVNETNQSVYVPAMLFSITMYMVPAVPLAQYTLLNHVNRTDDLWIPSPFMPEQPDVGTLLHLGFELSDPYYTFSGRQVFDVTTAVLFRPNGGTYQRGHNATWCGPKKDFRRIVAGTVTSNNLTLATGASLPKHNTGNDQDKLVPMVGGERFNVHEFGYLDHLWRFQGNVEEEPWVNEPIRLRPIFLEM